MGLRSWLISATVVLAMLLALFQFVDPERLAGDWPLGIGDQEVDAYADLLEWRGDTSSGSAERYLISSAVGACIADERGTRWSRHWFEAEGFGDSVKVRRLRTREGGYVIRFGREEPFRSQRHIVLTPADPSSLRAKYIEILAQELGLIVPEVSFIRLIACGRDLGLYLKEERIDADFLEKRGLPGAALATQGHDAGRPDHLFPAFEEDSLAPRLISARLSRAFRARGSRGEDDEGAIMDAEKLAAALIMAWVEHGDDAFTHEHLLAYDWSMGRMVPLHRGMRTDESLQCTTRMLDPLTAGLNDEAVRAMIAERWLRLGEEAWRLRERFSVMDRAWLPLLAEGRSTALSRARAARTHEDLIGDARLKMDPLAGLDVALKRYAGAEAFSVGIPSVSSSSDSASVLAGLLSRTKAHRVDDTIFFPRGRYAIDGDLVFPHRLAVVLEQGARIELAANVSVVVNGGLRVLGTSRNPVFIRAKDDSAPFGSFAVLGEGETTVSITGLQMSGGREARIDGVYFSGMLAVHGAMSTTLSDCIISGSFGEDLLNIKGGRAELRGCTFEDGHADLVDLDRCTGSVSSCVFRNGRDDANGDGLDVSGSRILVQDCAFSALRDKGISVGEASQLLVMGSRFQANGSALVAKDLSIAYASDNAFIGNRTVFAAYRKKPIYGGARVVRYRNLLDANAQEQQADELSAIVEASGLDEKVRRMFGLQ